MNDTISAKISRRVKRTKGGISDIVRSASLPDGKSIWTQVREIAKLRMGPTKLSAAKYCRYNIADKKYKSMLICRPSVGRL